MTIRAVSPFDVTGWDRTPYGNETEKPFLSRATVGKTFRGDLVGESTAEALMCQSDTTGLAGGAGYVASELVEACLENRTGTFVMQHWGVSGGGGPEWTSGHIVPGSGTGELAGLSGTIEISVDSDGLHTLTLDYDIA